MISVQSGQYYIVFAESDTGIVVTLDGARNVNSDTPYIVFDCFEDAEKHANQKVSEMPYIDCNIYNDKSEFIKVIRNDFHSK